MPEIRKERSEIMRKMRNNYDMEKGQIIVIVALAMFALIAMAALIVDGGALMVNRRAAQNAADAGALAGAEVMCRMGYYDQASVKVAVEKFTIEENNASDVVWKYVPAGESDVYGLKVGEIEVTAGVSQVSLFARILGQDSLTASATAAAGCFPFQPGVVLPIAYPCRGKDPDIYNDTAFCDFAPIDWSVIEDITSDYGFDPLGGTAPHILWGVTTGYPIEFGISQDLFYKHDVDGNIIYEDGSPAYSNYGKYNSYIVMDSDLVCGEDGLNCAIFEEDGIDKYQLNSSARGWLNLEGINPSTTSLRNWVKYGSDVQEHTWLSFIGGNKVPGYDAIAERLDTVVWIPVIYGECMEFPQSGVACYDAPHKRFPVPEDGCSTDNIFQDNVSEQAPAAHVVAFVPFFPTCVQKDTAIFYDKKTMPEEFEDCPGFVKAQEENPDLIADNTISLEGFFITVDSLPEGDEINFGADMGYYKAYLIR